MKQFLFLMLFVSQLGWSQSSQTKQVFSLEQAIEYALEHNYNMINASRDIKDAQLQKWVTIASGLPQIDANINYTNQLKQPVSLIPAEFTGGEPGSFVPVIFGVPQGAGATVTLRQQIFDGSYIVGVQAVKTFLKYAANSQDKTAQEVTKMVTQAYGNALMAKEGVAIVQKNRDNLAASLAETKEVVSKGLAEEEQAEQLQITLANVESQLKNFKRLAGISHQLFNLSLGLPIETPTEFSDKLERLAASHADLSLTAQDFLIENNVDYKMALNLNEQRYFEHKLAKSRALPTLTSFVNYGANGFGDNFNFLNGSQQWFQSSVLGVDLRIPLFSSFGRDATTKRAKIALLKSQTQLTEAEERIRLQWQQAKSDFTLAVENHLTAKENLALASRIAQKNETKFKAGLASSFELRQAQLQLYSAQQSYLEAMVAVINQKTNLSEIVQPTSLN